MQAAGPPRRRRPRCWQRRAMAALLLLLATAAAPLVQLASAASPTDREKALLSPPMGWRAWYASNAHGLKDPTQAFVEQSMEAMADRSRLVDGVPTSLADLGYTRASVDGRYLGCKADEKFACKYDCGGVNGSYHDAEGRPVLNISNFPDVAAMVEKAHSLNLSAGWYTNNFQASNCESGWGKTPELHDLHMKGETEWMADMQFDEVKVDSGGDFNDMDVWERALNATGREIALENCHQGGEAPNASWCPFQQWRTSGDPKVVGWQNEMLDTAALLHRARRGCWAYPGYIIYGADAANNKTVNDTRTQFGAHVIMSSPLILSIDITDPLDQYWDIIANKEAIAVNQQWAGSVGGLIRKSNPTHENESSPLYAWGVDCNSSDVSKTVWTADAQSGLTVEFGGETLCLEKDRNGVGMRLCNASNPAQGFALNTTSGYVEHLDLGHGSMKPSEACLRVSSTSLKETPVLGPFVSAATCYDGGSGVSRAGARFNLTESGELVSAMGVTAWRQRKDWSKAPPPPGVAGPCLVPRRGWPNKYGPMQLWSKPQPGGTAAVFIQSTGSTWGNNNVYDADFTFTLNEIPGLPEGTKKVKVRDLWNHVDLPDVSGGMTTDLIKPGDSRFFLLTPATD